MQDTNPLRERTSNWSRESIATPQEPHFRRFLALVAVIAGCAGSGNGLAQSTAPDKKSGITIGATSNTLSSVNRLVAETDDTFGKNGIEVRGKSVYFNGSTSNMIAGVLSGDVDFGYGGATAVINALRARAPIQIVGVTVTNVTELGVSVKALNKLRGVNERSPIAARMEALKGMTIATAPAASTNNVVLRQLLSEFNLDPAKDVTIVTADPNSIPSGIRNGRFDAGFWTVGLLEQNFADDSAVPWVNVAAANIPGLSDITIGVVIATTAYIREHPQVVRAYHKSLVDAGSLIRQKNAATKAAVKAKYFPDLPAKTFDLTWDTAVSGLAYNASVSRAGFQALVNFMKKSSPENDYSNVMYEASVWEGARE